MRLNIFRNPTIDAQVGYLVDTYQDALRNQTRDYWTEKISMEIAKIIMERISDFNSCCDDDECQIMARGLEVVLDDIRYFYGRQSHV
jgi:hypothetical protein